MKPLPDYDPDLDLDRGLDRPDLDVSDSTPFSWREFALFLIATALAICVIVFS